MGDPLKRRQIIMGSRRPWLLRQEVGDSVGGYVESDALRSSPGRLRMFDRPDQPKRL